MTHKYCVSVVGPSLEQAKEQVVAANKVSDLIELRVDLINYIQLKNLKLLLSISQKPVLITDHSNQNLYHDLIQLQPDFLDLDLKYAYLMDDLSRLSPRTQFICSIHLDTQPADLESHYEKMRHFPLVKIAIRAKNCLDSLRMLAFLKKYQNEKLIGICMDEPGIPTRILGPIFGSKISFCCLDSNLKSAPGQLDIISLKEIYHHSKINLQTSIYGLIGEPVIYSQGHETHNAWYREHNLNAVYVKFPVARQEVGTFLELAYQLGIKGLSVTMPHKETVVQYCYKAHASTINTLVATPQGWEGYNTDGLGAVQALLKAGVAIKGKKVILLGAGGTATAIAAALSNGGGNLLILNRNKDRAQKLAELQNASWGDLKDFSSFAKSGYDILINATSVGFGNEMECPIDPAHLLARKIVMDVISTPKTTKLIQKALEKQCHVVYGTDLFECQAKYQFDLWLGCKQKC